MALRLLLYLALQALVVVGCLGLAALPTPEPPPRWQLTEAWLEPPGAAVSLPHHHSARFTMADPPRYGLAFDRPAGLPEEPWSVLLPRFTNGVAVAVNGVEILDSRRNPAANRPDRSSPEIAVIPSSLLREGRNELTVRLFVWGPLTGFLDRIHVGPDAMLRPAHDQRVLLFVTLPIVLAAWQSILAVILGMMWLMRRHEPEYGALAASMALGVAQTFISAPSGQSLYAGLNAVLIASAPLESAFAVVFLVLFLGLRLPRAAALLFLPGLIILDVASDRRIFFSRISYSAMVIAVGIGLTWRFARALNQVDSFAGSMVTLVREAEDKLRASLARDEERARAIALSSERSRLMRDLHDGLGGQLVSIVALSERQQAAPIGEAARAALKDLRLVIDAMDDIGGDLMLALGAWRERIAAQLRAHSIALAWRVLTPQGLPVHRELRPGHVIQILRLLDEAVTNAVKHAGAGTITVEIETVAATDGDRGRISVRDDGRGFDAEAGSAAPPLAGRGLANMRQRAERCGGQLAIVSGPEGTRVTLDLPSRFADLDAPRV
ncbi:MAG: hypothetical protein B7Z14_09475 [Bosea sp. 32-68-6]|nr:MAG: hypothetical protein B7Z14_09475 [Bosea sp. 32-68-6]